MCSINEQWNLRDLQQEVALIIWDEVHIQHCFKALIQTLTNI